MKKTPLIPAPSPFPCLNHLSYGQPISVPEIEAVQQQLNSWIQHQGPLPVSLSDLKALKARVAYLERLGEKEDLTLDDHLLLLLELFATEIRLDKTPQGIKKQRREANKYARDRRAGRKRNNKKAAKRLVEIFRNELLWRRENGRTPQEAGREATDYVLRHLRTESRATDKAAVSSLFKDLLQKDQQH